MREIKIAFWNVGNLFDTTASELATDLEFTPEHGWTQQAYDTKVANLAAVLNALHGGAGPDLLGLCEVENVHVVKDLIKAMGRTDLQVAHIDSKDIRGIDCTLVYSDKLFRKPAKSDMEGHTVHLRYATRDIFEVRLKLKGSGTTPELIVLVNHWPSRKNGQYETEPLRLTAAEHTGRLVDSYLKYSKQEFMTANPPLTLDQLNVRWNRNVLLMGDFNDEPYSRSMLDYLQASKDLDHVEELVKGSAGGRPPSVERYLKVSAHLFNPMWALLAVPDRGTHYFSSATNSMNLLDQFILTRGLVYGTQRLKFDPASVAIFSQAPAADARGRPRNFDREKLTGVSDHLPITARIQVLGP
jgi:hypothetical protein